MLMTCLSVSFLRWSTTLASRSSKRVSTVNLAKISAVLVPAYFSMEHLHPDVDRSLGREAPQTSNVLFDSLGGAADRIVTLDACPQDLVGVPLPPILGQDFDFLRTVIARSLDHPPYGGQVDHAVSHHAAVERDM